MLQDWLTTYEEYTQNTEPPSLYHTWTGIAVLAAVLRRKCVFNWGTIAFYPNMYIVLVGPSGKCRKGTAMTIGFKFLKQLGIKVAAESITREALIRELKQSGNDPQIDVTTGKIQMHSSLTIYSQELTVFLGYNNQQLMADLTDWYDCRDQWTYRTKNMGTDEIHGVWVNLFGATTPDLLQSTLPRDAVGGGLTSRMIFVYEEKKHRTVVCPFQTKEEAALEQQLLIDLERISLMSGEFRVTDEFIELWSEWYMKVDNAPPIFDDYRFAGYMERRPTHLLKLCSIISASRSSEMIINGADFKRALSIMEMTEVKMPFAFCGMGKYKDSDVMHRIIATLAAHGSMSRAELQRRFYQDVDKQAMDSILATLVSMESVTIVYGERDIMVHYKGE